jgi:hypothetical protein
MKERAKTIWMGNGFGIEFVVGDPWTIFLHLILEKDPTMTDNTMKTIASNDVHRKTGVGVGGRSAFEQSVHKWETRVEPMRHFAERARLEALAWAESEISDYKLTEDLVKIMSDVIDSSE